MPHKFNDARGHKITRQKYQITNWSAYNENLRQRGDLAVRMSDDALCLWSASRSTSRGGQPKYSDLAITLCLTLRVVYGLPLCQTQGLMDSVVTLMGGILLCQIFSTLSRRSKGQAMPSARRQAASSEPVHLVFDSTG